MIERRSHERSALSLDAHVATGPETPLPHARTIDVSPAGILLAFAEPVGVPLGSRVVVTLELDDGRFHAIGFVQRVDRGDDFRTYVAATFDELSHDEFRRLVTQFGAEHGDGDDRSDSTSIP